MCSRGLSTGHERKRQIDHLPFIGTSSRVRQTEVMGSKFILCFFLQISCTLRSRLSVVGVSECQWYGSYCYEVQSHQFLPLAGLHNNKVRRCSNRPTYPINPAIPADLHGNVHKLGKMTTYDSTKLMSEYLNHDAQLTSDAIWHVGPSDSTVNSLVETIHKWMSMANLLRASISPFLRAQLHLKPGRRSSIIDQTLES